MKNRHTTVDVSSELGGRHCLPLPLYSVLACSLFSVNLLLVSKLVIAEPYIPENNDMVLDYLPETLTILSNTTKSLERRLARKKSNGKQWGKLIKEYLSEAKASGDMRYVSYAQNHLKTWLQQAPLSEKARLLDVQIKQYNHEFNDAVIQLKALLIDYPENNEAWSLLANIQLLTGNYQDARSSCKQLSRTSSLVDMIICQSNIMIRTGELNKANKMLDVLVSAIEKIPAQKRLWLYTSLAEIKIQQGNNQHAGLYIEKAMKLLKENNKGNTYLLKMAVDLLIQEGDLKKAFELVQIEKSDSALLIRSTLLARELGKDVIFKRNKIALTQIFEIEKRRGINRHLREHALFTLHILDNSVEALKLAKQNWMMQKEPEDARILMKSALLSGDSAQLQWVKKSINKTGMVDYRLNDKRLRKSLL